MATDPRLHRASLPRSAFCFVLLAGLLATATAKAEPPTQTPVEAAKAEKGTPRPMRVHYLEIVTPDVDAVCAAYSASLGVTFSKPVPMLGNARTAPLADGGMLGVRAPMRETEAPVVRPYWLVDDIKAAVDAAVKNGGQLALPPTEMPGMGTFAIYLMSGIDHGLWQK